ncbi:MAG: DNA primase, partial [Nanoarchaeota archaeon]|nr:DNA primase [Nanoarchaeota archaeon]
MGRVSDVDIANIREAASIVDIVGANVPLRRSGREYTGLCPFHQDHTPSLHVNPQKGIYKCFACGAGGDVFGYVMRRDGVGFLEAVRSVAETKGLHVKFSGEDHARAIETAPLYEALETATKLFQRALNSNSSAQDYLFGERKVESATAEDFRIGFAPDEWDYLLQSLGPGSNAGISLETLERSGLVHARRDHSGFYDYFRNRIIFPITDPTGRVVGFSGRDLSGDPKAPKYLNTPESPVFRKGEVLFGLTQAAPLIKAERQAVVVEGYLDAVTGQQADFPTIAVGGTAFTRQHAETLRRRHPGLEIFLTFDGDSAGQTAADKASAQLLGSSDTYVCLLPDGQDPADILTRERTPGTTLFDTGTGGKEAFARILSQGVPIFEHYMSHKLKGRKLDGPAAVSEFLRGMAKDLQGVPRDVLPVYVNEISRRTNIDHDSIHQALSNQEYEKHRGRTIPPRDHLETELIHGLMILQSVVERFREVLTPDTFTSPERRAVVAYLLGGHEVSSVHTPLFQAASDATERIMRVPGNEELRSHLLYGLLSPPNNIRRKNLGHFLDVYQMIQAWEAFRRVNEAGHRGHSIERISTLVAGLEETLHDWETPGNWKNVEDLPGARVVGGKYLLVERSWAGEQIPGDFGTLGEYLLKHGANFAQTIGASPVTDIAAGDRLVSFDIEDSPAKGNQIISIASTTYTKATLRNSTLFARTDREEPLLLEDFLPTMADFDTILTYRGDHDIAAVRRRANAHFGNNSRAQGLVAQMRRKHRDISAISRKITDGKTLDRRLKTA